MKRSRLNPMSKKRRASLPERERVRLEVFQRDGGCTFKDRSKAALGAGRITLDEFFELTECHGPMTPHHLRKASAGGSYTADNLTVLCSHHNGWVEDNPNMAHRMGLVLRRGEAA